MVKNFIPELEKLLGVQIGEKFKIKTAIYEDQYYFDNQLRLWGIADNRISNYFSLRNILSGEFEIMKLPFEPKQDEEYWYVTSDGEADENVYTGSTLDKYCAISGNRFRTEDDAKNNAPRIVKEVFGNELP